MTALADWECKPCRAKVPASTPEEILEMRAHIPEWEVILVEDYQCLKRRFAFKNFAQALAFTNKVGAIAEEVNHHPQVVTEWGGVTVCWWTHTIKDLNVNDFIMAARTDGLLCKG